MCLTSHVTDLKGGWRVKMNMGKRKVSEIQGAAVYYIGCLEPHVCMVKSIHVFRLANSFLAFCMDSNIVSCFSSYAHSDSWLTGQILIILENWA